MQLSLCLLAVLFYNLTQKVLQFLTFLFKYIINNYILLLIYKLYSSFQLQAEFCFKCVLPACFIFSECF